MPADTVRIAHLSDLHFGARGDQTVWNTLVDYLCNTIRPELVLVTGDLVDTPKAHLFQRAYQALENLNNRLGWAMGQDKKYVVCAGNHDRHRRGNASPFRNPVLLFDSPDFQFNPPSLQMPYTGWLGTQPHRWRVRIATVDSSFHALYSAQAFLEDSILRALRDLKNRDDAEPPFLVLLLIHHHLLPIPATESDQSFWKVFQLTSAVNPGKILETLAESYVDLVLHGHEHRRHLARYASYKPRAGQLAIVASASATGMETFDGWSAQRASFNILELRTDRSVWIREAHGPEPGQIDWEMRGPALELLDSTTLRHNRFLRSSHLWRRQAAGGAAPGVALEDWTVGRASEWQKHITLTGQRDALVRERRTDWLLPNGEFSFKIQNDTGQPAQPQAERLNLVRSSPQQVLRPRVLPFAPVRDEPGAYRFLIDTGSNDPVRAALIETSYQWLDAVLLTSGDFELIDTTHAGPHRRQGREFVAASVITPLNNLTLSVTFPVGYSPGRDHVRVYHQGLSPLEAEPSEDPALLERLQFAGQTLVLNVPYPLKDYRYVIAWEPISSRPLTPAAAAFQNRARRDGDLLAARLLGALGDTTWSKHATATIYVPERDAQRRHRYLDRVGFCRGRELRAAPEVPPNLDLRESKGLYRHAWWNESGIVGAGREEVGTPRARTEGMLGGELVFAVVPLAGLGSIGDVPWAIARIGVMDSAGVDFEDPAQIDMFRRALERGHLSMLSYIQEN